MREQVAEAYQTGKKAMKRLIYAIFFAVVLFAAGAVFVKYYSYIFARSVHGVIINVEKPNSPMAVVGAGSDKLTNDLTEKLVFAYAVAIQQADGEIVTASTEDKQWAVAEKGKCAEAKFFPYPPWRFDKAGTYFGARLLKMYDCSMSKSDAPPLAPANAKPTPAPESAPTIPSGVPKSGASTKINE